MKKFLVLPAFALAAALVGCEPAAPVAPVTEESTTTTTTDDTTDAVIGDAETVEEVDAVVEETDAP